MTKANLLEAVRVESETATANDLQTGRKMSEEVFTQQMATRIAGQKSASNNGETSLELVIPNPEHIYGLEKHFPELDGRAKSLLQDMNKVNPQDAAKIFAGLASDPSMQKYDAIQIQQAFVTAIESDPSLGRFEFSAASDGTLTMFDSQNPKPESVTASSIKMYNDDEMKAQKENSVETDEEAAEKVCAQFATNNLDQMTSEQIAKVFYGALQQLKDAHADPYFAAAELSSALSEAGSKYVVRNRKGTLSLLTKEEEPRTTIKVTPSF